MGFDSPVDLAWLKKYKWLPLKNPYEKWDFIIIQSKFFLSAFCSALSCGTEKILITGLPRNDILYYPKEKNKEKVLKKIGIPSGQEIVLYAPTFRDEGDNITLHCEAIKKIFITQFPDKYLAIRLHPFDQSKIPKTLYSGNIINANNIEDIQDILQITNTLITDYSSVAFDFASSNKKIILYCPDRESYERSRGGLYFDIENLPFEYCETIDSLTNKIADDDTSYQYGEFGEHGACRKIESFMLAKNLIKPNNQSIKKGAI
ncbi:CDP-glycerol:poly(glycerophosphate) glycerophosphotransferase [compost metagenome]